MIALSQVQKGQKVKINSFQKNDLLTFSCIEIGLCLHSVIKVVDRLPFGGNLVVLSENGKYSLRKEDADCIFVDLIS